MADLGWQPQDARDTVELTMPPHDLMEIATRLCDEAHGSLANAEEDRESVAPPVIKGYEDARYLRHDPRGVGRG
jgi:hypothetical protein